MRSAVESLQLTDFRSYRQASLEAAGRPVALHGPNGSGKTNLLEALSLFSPGRGLRGAPLAEIGRREVGEAVGRAWAISAQVRIGDDERTLGTGTETAGATRRIVRLDRESVAPGRMADLVRPLWLTPAQDRLFLEPASERRRFFDRLVFAADPDHAAQVVAYEKALRDRNRLLFGEETADPAWLSALESQMAEAGARMALARARTLEELSGEIAERGERAFPRADLALSGRWEIAAAGGADGAALAAELRDALAGSRTRDRAAGRALEGPHRGDLVAVHRALGRPASECSTGEQKALILNLVLAQAARLSRAISAPNPILLLDEVAAHLDAPRRAALFDEIEALGLQAFLTGTDAALFESLDGRALIVRVEAGALYPNRKS